jgi:hypothetical protein
VATQEFFGESFRALKLRWCATWTKTAQADRLEGVNDAEHKRRFGADDGEINGFASCQLDEACDVIGRNGNIAKFGLMRRTGITGRDQYFGDARRLRTLPG